MKNLSLEFSETGGYDCMTSAWTIYKDNRPLVDIDLAKFGQKPNEEISMNDERALEARKIAEICYAALLKA